MPGTTILKVSVLASNELLLDGHSATLAELEQAMEQSAGANAVVWYYRENAAGEAPPVAGEVMKLIISRRLAVRLSSKPDFSDAVVPTSMPDQIFSAVRAKAAERQLVIVRPDGRTLLLPALAREAAPEKLLAAVEQLLPSKVPLNVAVIGDTSWTTSAAPDITAANQAIPFFGYLMGFAAIGHHLWVFDGSAACFSAGCRDADVLIVDSAHLAKLPQDWQESAAKVMRHPDILIHDRATYQLRKP